MGGCCGKSSTAVSSARPHKRLSTPSAPAGQIAHGQSSAEGQHPEHASIDNDLQGGTKEIAALEASESSARLVIGRDELADLRRVVDAGSESLEWMAIALTNTLEPVQTELAKKATDGTDFSVKLGYAHEAFFLTMFNVYASLACVSVIGTAPYPPRLSSLAPERPTRNTPTTCSWKESMWRKWWNIARLLSDSGGVSRPRQLSMSRSFFIRFICGPYGRTIPSIFGKEWRQRQQLHKPLGGAWSRCSLFRWQM